MVVVVLMGVCGCGKTTIGEALADRLGCMFSDADDFHSEENKTKMRSSIPLTDEDRLPWLRKIHEFIRSQDSKSQTSVITCSALKRMYRDILRSGLTPPSLQHCESRDAPLVDNDTDTPGLLAHPTPKVVFVHLTGPRNVLEERLAGRKGHFMPADLLTSQLTTLEEPGEDENCLTVDIGADVPQIVDTIMKNLPPR